MIDCTETFPRPNKVDGNAMKTVITLLIGTPLKHASRFRKQMSF